MLRLIFSIVIGIVVGVALIELVQNLGHSIYPTDIDPNLPKEELIESIKEYLKTAPKVALLFVPLSYFVGSFTGSVLGMLIKRKNSVAYSTTIVLMIFGVINLFQRPHPTWLIIIIVLSFPAGLWLALNTISKKEN